MSNNIRIVIIISIILVGLTAGVFLFKPICAINKPNAVNPVGESSATATSIAREAENLIQSGKKPEAIKKLEDTASADKGTKKGYESLLALADIYEKDHNLLKAREIYSEVLIDYASYCDYPSTQKKISSLNVAIIFSSIPTQESEIYTVVSGDSLTKIAKKYSTTVDLIKKANNLTTDTIIPGKKLKVQKIPFSIVVDKSQSTLTLFMGDNVIKTYTVSTGKNNSTPIGNFKIQNKLLDPVWYAPGGAAVPAKDPKNALGSRWMGFNISQPDYGIHGTNEPQSIGYQCTEGCVRMNNDEVEELFIIIPTGTEVTIID